MIPNQVARERALQLAPAFEGVEGPCEVPLAVASEVIIRKEDLAHSRKIEPRVDLIEHLGPVPEVDVAAQHRLGAVGVQLDAVEMHLPTIQREGRAHLGFHWLERSDPDRAIREGGLTTVVQELRDGHAQVRRDHTPRRHVVLVGKLSAVCADVLQGRHESPVFRVLRQSVGGGWAGKVGEAVAAVRERLDEHLEVGHIDRVDQKLPTEQRAPRDRDEDALTGEEGAVVRRQTLDDHVFDHKSSGQEVDRQLAHMHRPLDLCRCSLLRPGAEGRPEIHADERDERRRSKGSEVNGHQPGVPPHPVAGGSRRGFSRRLRATGRARLIVRLHLIVCHDLNPNAL